MTAFVDENDDFTLETASDLPWQVELSDIKENGLILPKDEVAKLKNSKLRKKNETYSRNILSINQKNYAFYKSIYFNLKTQLILAQDVDSKEFVAVKKVSTNNQKTQKRVQKEIKALKQLGYLVDSIRVQKHTYIVMKFIQKPSLNKLIGKTLPAQRLFRISKNYLRAANNFLKGGMYHRDHKPHNAVLDDNDNVKLIDFGTIKKTNSKTNKTLQGTLAYMAPELMEAAEQDQPLRYTEKTEVYAMGMGIAHLSSLIRIAGQSFLKLLDEKDISEPVGGLSEIQAKKLLKFLQRMTHQDPKERPTLKQCEKFFEECEHECLTTLSKFQTVGIVKLSELKDQVERFAEPLRQFDKVYVVNDTDSVELHTITGRLREEAVTVSGIIKPRNPALANFSNATSYLERNNESVIATYIPVSAEDNVGDGIQFLKVKTVDDQKESTSTYQDDIKKFQAEENLDKKKLELIIKLLEKEKVIQRKNHKPAERIEAINEAIKAIDLMLKEELFQVQHALHILEALQSKVVHTNPIERFLEEKTNFWRPPASREGIKKIAEKISLASTKILPSAA